MLINKIVVNISTLFIILLTNAICHAEVKESYVDGSRPFLAIEDVNRQSEAWATCAATYNAMAELFGETPAQSKQFKELGNGAALCVTMSLVAKDLNENITPSQFNALWSYAKMAGSEWPQSHMTTILADAERTPKENANQFLGKLTNSFEICMGNLEGQQFYIDMWRELAKSGLLQTPTE